MTSMQISGHNAAPVWASRGFGRGRLLQAELLDRGLAHLEFLDFSGNRHRKLVDESDIARDLKMRQLPLAEVPHILLRKRRPLAQPDPGAQLLAVLRVRHAD